MSFPAPAPILLLIASNVLMTLARYGHLKFGDWALPLVIVTSWNITFFEYCLAVSANRIGHATYAPGELKVIQDVITLGVFAVFSSDLPRRAADMEPRGVGFGLICAGACFVFDGPFGKGSGLPAMHRVPLLAFLPSRG